MDTNETAQPSHDVHVVDAWLGLFVMRVHLACQTVCQPWHERITRYIAQYEGGENAPRRGAGSTSDLYPNITQESVHTILAYLVNALFLGGTLQFYEIEADDQNDVDQIPVVKRVMHHYLRNCGYLSRKIETLRRMLVAGTAIEKHGWRYEVGRIEQPTEKPARRKRQLSRFAAPARQLEFRKRWGVITDMPMVEPVDIRNFFIPDDTIESLDDLDYCGERYWRTRRALARQELDTINDPRTGQKIEIGMYRNTELIPQGGLKEKPQSGMESIAAIVDIAPITDTVECLEYTFRDLEAVFSEAPEQLDWKGRLKDFWAFDDEDLEGGAVVTIANGLPVRIDPLPDPAGRLTTVYVPWICEYRDGAFFGIGIPERMESEQIELTALRNRGMDLVARSLNKRRIIDSQLVANRAELETYRDQQIIYAANPSGRPIAELIYDDVPAPLPGDFWAYVGQIKADAEAKAATPDVARGLAAASRTTYGEIKTRTANLGVRFELIAIRLENESLSPSLRNVYRWIARRLTRPLAIFIVGQRGVGYSEVVNQEQIWGDFRFVPVGVRETANRYIRSQQRIQLLNNPLLAAHHDIVRTLRQWYVDIGLPDDRDLIVDPQKPTPMMDVADQWSVFLRGRRVEVTGRETLQEHIEAIRLHRDVFLAQVIPALLESKQIMRQDIEQTASAVEANIKEHQWCLQSKIEKTREAMAMAGMTGPPGQTGRLGMRTLPLGASAPVGPFGQESIETAATAEPGPTPNREGMTA